MLLQLLLDAFTYPLHDNLCPYGWCEAMTKTTTGDDIALHIK